MESVSYTHLDVYKRQPYGKVFGGTNGDGPPCTLNGFTGARNGAIVPEWELSVRVKPNKGAEPVSYTHLDVYKRQAVESTDTQIANQFSM